MEAEAPVFDSKRIPKLKASGWSRGQIVEHVKKRSREKGVPFNGTIFAYNYDHPLRCGYDGVQYDLADYVSPICDSLSHTHKRIKTLQGCFWKARSDKLSDPVAESGAGYTNMAPPVTRTLAEKQTGSSLRCKSMKCCNVDPLGFEPNRDGFLVCKLCGVEGEQASYDETWGETHNDTERSGRTATAKNSTARAEVDFAQAFRFPTIKKHPFPGSRVPEDARRKCGMGYAADIANRTAADRIKDDLPDDDERRKLTGVIICINTLAQSMRAEDAIVQQIRMLADVVFRRAVKHAAVCRDRKTCQYALSAKPAQVIAQKCFFYTLGKLNGGQDSVNGVSFHQINTLLQKCNSSPDFCNADNATQHSGCEAMIAAIDAQPERMCMPCVKPTPPARQARVSPEKGRSPVSDLPLARQASGLSSAESCAGTKLRDAVDKVYRMGSFPDRVRDAAIVALQDPKLHAAIKGDSIIPAEVSVQGKAYILLRAAACGPHSIDSLLNQDSVNVSNKPLEARLHLQDVDVDDMVDSLRSSLPSEMGASSSMNDPDDLFIDYC